jgi:hypothetical protein
MIGQCPPGALTSSGVLPRVGFRAGVSTMSETVDSLTMYCRDNKRVCPLPKAWQQLWEMLPEKRRAVDAWEPAMPLIGAAGHDAPAMLKMVRLAEHLQWAAKHNALAEVATFLRDLREDEWHHLDE